MSNFNYRTLLLASAGFCAALSARAQFVDVLTESPVTIQASLQSTVTTTTTVGATTTTATTSSQVRLSNQQVIQDLIDSQIINDSTVSGWSLVAVRSVPTDLFFVDAGFALYAVKAGFQPVEVPSSKFQAVGFGSIAKYTEKNLGRYVLSSSGTLTNHVSCAYSPTFTNGAFTYKLTQSESDGFANVKFATKDASDDFEVFFYAISSIQVTTRGGYTGTIQQGNNPTSPSTGLISITVKVDAPKLVPASKYPAVYPGL